METGVTLFLEDKFQRDQMVAILGVKPRHWSLECFTSFAMFYECFMMFFNVMGVMQTTQ